MDEKSSGHARLPKKIQPLGQKLTRRRFEADEAQKIRHLQFINSLVIRWARRPERGIGYAAP